MSVDQLSPAALAEARELMAERIHWEGRSVQDVSDEELVEMIDDPEVGYEGGAAKLQADMDGGWQ